MAANHLDRSRHGTVCYFRRRIPLQLQSIIGSTVLVQSLQTSDLRSAVIRSRAVAEYGGADAEHYEHLKSEYARLYRDGNQPSLSAVAEVLHAALSAS